MTVSSFGKNLLKHTKRNSPEILTILSVSGVVTTAYLSGLAGFKAGFVVHHEEGIGGTHENPKVRFKERFKQTWRIYIPAAASGAVTVGCIIGATKASSKKTLAAATAYSITEKAFSDYKEKVVEEIGKTKEERIRDSIAQDTIATNPPDNKEVLVLGSGQVLCCELYTKRYFKSDVESLRKAQNDVNQEVINQLYVSLSEFYDLVGLSHTTYSDEIGWDSMKLMELKFSTVLSESGEPCLAFDYNYVKPLD